DGQVRGQRDLDAVWLVCGPFQGRLGGDDIPLILIPDGQRHADLESVDPVERCQRRFFQDGGANLDVREGGGNLSGLEAVAGTVDGIARGEYVSVVADNVGQDGVVIVAGNQLVDTAGNLGQWQLAQANGRDDLLPRINVGGDGL